MLPLTSAGADIATPPSRGGILNGQAVPAFLARLGARLAKNGGGPWRIGKKVVVAGNAQVQEALARDLEFGIAPINGKRIAEVDDAFVLGMDRGAILTHEREALYRALAAVDGSVLIQGIESEIAERIRGANEIDVVNGYARPIAAHTAQRLFGVCGDDDDIFMDVARAVFAHTFLNLSGDEAVRQRALRASVLMKRWLADEVDRRLASGDAGTDMMGALISQGMLDSDGIVRTLGGMLVGAVDTTATAVAKIAAVIAGDRKLLAEVSADCDDAERMRGWCWEALRRWPHNPVLLRQALCATTLAGATVRKGDQLYLWTQAAMQDPSAFPDPQRLRPDRSHEHYLHFGGALHVCAGRSINAFQIPMLVTGLVRRGIASVGSVAWAGPFPDRLVVRLEK
jgi:cytochrome P450